jgi:hypothetical protein
LVLLALACATQETQPQPELAAAWKAFLSLPPQRAMAIAGEFRRGPWVTASSGGHATQADAENEALTRCRVRREARRMRAECVIYAVGSEIVWRGR